MLRFKIVLPLMMLAVLCLCGCVTTSTFPLAARAGDTIVVPIGWNKSLTRQNVQVLLQPAAGAPITYASNHPGIRAIINLYPDPVSRLVIGGETQQGFGLRANEYATALANRITAQDKDWWQTVLYVDLPTSLSPGRLAISVLGPEGSVTQFPFMIDVLSGNGKPIDSAAFGGTADEDVQNLLASLERAEHVTVSFTGDVVPHAIQVHIAHNPADAKRWVVNPRGDLKNLTWSDDGSEIRVLLTPTQGQTLSHLEHFKFYISGATAGLRVSQIRAYDVDGNLIPNVQLRID